MPSKVQPGMKYSCGVCNKICGVWSVCCGMCNMWYHRKCERLSTRQFSTLKELSLRYYCQQCFGEPFDFECSLARLADAVKLENLKEAVALERILMRQVTLPPNGCVGDVSHHTLDKAAENILRKFEYNPQHMPVAVSGDGNCLFNSLSVAIYGNELCATELRLRTALEMVENRSYYERIHATSRIHLVSPDYNSACRDCVSKKGFSSAWTINAAASVLERPIKSVYPPLNGFEDECYVILNTQFQPRTMTSKEPICIMWTLLGSLASTSGIWTPNHFVPLLSDKIPIDTSSRSSYEAVQNSISTSTACQSMDCGWPSLEEAYGKRMSPVSTNRTDSDENTSASPVSSAKSKITSENSSDVHGASYYWALEDERNIAKNEIVVNRPSINEPTHDDSKLSLDEDRSPKNTNESVSELEQPLGMTTPMYGLSDLPTPGKFMTVTEMYKILTAKDLLVHKRIPYGPKNNVYLLIDNAGNVEREKLGQRANHMDDCGDWDSKRAKTVVNYFVENSDGKLISVYLKENVFCVESRKRKMSSWHPIEPQPQNVVKIRRYYTHSKDPGSDYKKRVTTLYENNKPSDFALVEYCGIYNEDNCIAPGNSKKDITYVRTKPTVLEKTKTPKRVYQDMAEEEKMLKDKYNQSKKQRNENRTSVADEVLEVVLMLENNECLQEIIHKKGKPPCLILYSEEQLTDFRKNISTKIDGSNIIGVDRTFNLGASFLTLVVYKNMSVICADSGEHPIFLGPMFLHWDVDYETYHSFFSHLSAKLKDNRDNNFNIRIGNDQEAGLTEALKDCFPESTFVLCSKHIEDNVHRYLIDNVGCTLSERNDIIDKIFGNKGIATSKDELEFNNRLRQLDPYFATYPTFQKYCQDFLKSNIFEYICQPLIKGVSSTLWTNNNCKSINNIFKLEFNWHPQKLSELVDKVCTVSRLHSVC